MDLVANGRLKIQVSETSLRGNTAFYNSIPKDPKLILNISHVGIAVPLFYRCWCFPLGTQPCRYLKSACF